jgi:acyl carrier protein
VSAPTDDLRARVVAVLAAELDPALVGVDGPADDASLFDEMGLDSAGTMALVTGLEDEFAIEVPDEDLVRSNFETVAAIVAYVRRRGGG